jgi:hypothetical protein
LGEDERVSVRGRGVGSSVCWTGGTGFARGEAAGLTFTRFPSRFRVFVRSTGGYDARARNPRFIDTYRSSPCFGLGVDGFDVRNADTRFRS